MDGAERIATEDGEDEPGAEHILLAAFALPDGTAGRCFARFGVDDGVLRAAIGEQYRAALSGLGVDPAVLEPPRPPARPISTKPRLFRAKGSLESLMRTVLYEFKQRDPYRPLLGAHVVGAIATKKHGVAARCFRQLGIDADALLAAAQEEIDAFCA